MSGVLNGVNNGIGRVQNVIGQANSTLNSFGRLTTDVANLGTRVGGLLGFPGAVGLNLFGQGDFRDQLQEASWRGVPFAVLSSTVRRGRRVVVHEYPYRDDVWVEDLGLGVRYIRFRGFLLGDDCYAQRDQMIVAVETKGFGDLVHPSLGSVKATLTEAAFREDFERGRVVEVDLGFIQSGANKALYPTAVVDTPGAVLALTVPTGIAAASNFVSNALNFVHSGLSVIQRGLNTVTSFERQIVGVINDAASIAHAVTGLFGSFGRYDHGSLAAPLALPSVSAADLLAAAVPVRSAAQTSFAAAQTAAGLVNYGKFSTTAPVFATQMLATVEATRATASDPADQIRLLTNWYTSIAPPDPNVVPPVPSKDPTTASLANVATIVNDLCRRGILISMSSACAAYQPTSYDDAVTVRTGVTSLFDQEIQYSADFGDSETFTALKQLRAAVVQDSVTRGSQLPKLITVNLAQSLPVFTVAYLLHQDATRADDLISRVDPIHPSFMPTRFLDLAT